MARQSVVAVAPSLLRPLRMCTSAGASCTSSASVVLHEQRHGALCSCRAVRGCGSSAAVVAECCRRAYRAAALASHALSRRRGVAVARCMSRGLMPSARTIALRRVVGRAAVVAGRAYRTVALASHALSRRRGVAVVRCMSRGLVPSAWAIALRGVVGRAAVVAGWGRGGAYCAAAFVSHTLLRRRGVAAVRCMNRGREPSVHAALRRVGGCCRRACCAAALALHALSQRRGVAVARCMNRGGVPSVHAIALQRGFVGWVLRWSRHPAWRVGCATSPSRLSRGACVSCGVAASQDCPLGQGGP
jgi:hypothetical protein